MRRISDALKDIVQDHPFLEEALHHGFLNLTGFAAYARPTVEKETGKKVSLHAIKMALSRLERPKALAERPARFLASRVTTLTGLSVMSVARSPAAMRKIHGLFGERARLDGYCAVVEGGAEMDIVYDAAFRPLVRKAIPADLRVLEVEGLALCSLRLTDADLYRKGLLYEVTKRLAFHDVNIIQVISTYHECGLVVREEDLKKTVGVMVG